MLISTYKELCTVSLPHKGRHRYMWPINIENPVMEKGFEDYLEPVLKLLKAAGQTIGKAFITVDERIVEAGTSQRRPGPHVDGKFNEKAMHWGHGPVWNHSCNNLPISRTPIIIAASVAGCRAWEGQFDAEPKSDGDLSHVSFGEGVVLPANTAFLLSPDCIHESMVFEQDTKRTFLRIALPVEDE